MLPHAFHFITAARHVYLSVDHFLFTYRHATGRALAADTKNKYTFTFFYTTYHHQRQLIKLFFFPFRPRRLFVKFSNIMISLSNHNHKICSDKKHEDEEYCMRDLATICMPNNVVKCWPSRLPGKVDPWTILDENTTQHGNIRWPRNKLQSYNNVSSQPTLLYYGEKRMKVLAEG